MSWEPYAVAAAACTSVFGLGYLYRVHLNRKWGHCSSRSDLKDKVFIITGANSGLGKATAQILANRNATVVMACRNVAEAQAIAVQLQKKNPQSKIDMLHLDLGSLDSVQHFADTVLEKYTKIDCLINNAGVYVPDKKMMKTADGFEYHFGVNHLGHFLLTNLLLPRLKESAPSRVVVVSSMLHEKGNIDFENLNFEREIPVSKRGAGAGYCNSKLANALFASELAKQTEGSDVSVYALCPGWVYTGLFRNSSIPWYGYIAMLPVGFMFMRGSKSGAQTIVHCATCEKLEGKNWGFYRDCKPYTSKALERFGPETAKRLWEVSAKLVKLVK